MAEFTSRDHVAARLREIVDELWIDGAPGIRDDTRLREDLGLDSLDEVEITVAAEEAFGLGGGADLDGKVEKVVTFGELVDVFCAELNIAVPA